MSKIETISLSLNATQSTLVFMALTFFVKNLDRQISKPEATEEQREQFLQVICMTETVLFSLGALIDAAADAERAEEGLPQAQAAYMVN